MDPTSLALYLGKEIGKSLMRSRSGGKETLENKVAKKMWTKIKKEYERSKCGRPSVVRTDITPFPFKVVKKGDEKENKNIPTSKFDPEWCLVYECPYCGIKNNHVYKPKVIFPLKSDIEKNRDSYDASEVDEEDITVYTGEYRVCLECGGRTETSARYCTNCCEITPFLVDNPEEKLRVKRRDKKIYCFNCKSTQVSEWPRYADVRTQFCHENKDETSEKIRLKMWNKEKVPAENVQVTVDGDPIYRSDKLDKIDGKKRIRKIKIDQDKSVTRTYRTGPRLSPSEFVKNCKVKTWWEDPTGQVHRDLYQSGTWQCE